MYLFTQIDLACRNFKHENTTKPIGERDDELLVWSSRFGAMRRRLLPPPSSMSADRGGHLLPGRPSTKLYGPFFRIEMRHEDINHALTKINDDLHPFGSAFYKTVRDEADSASVIKLKPNSGTAEVATGPLKVH
ncbi:hypothetical protein D9613_007192 [Agrocybe pediades]|uniref:Uncharacterized protein n=1 Tax=Agrocybe pediades TaxID=84607 RepID=A0A8H4VKL4_9AGAR|nr:hypothetical protein D9613_007192 [Agrocybe pediades]